MVSAKMKVQVSAKTSVLSSNSPLLDQTHPVDQRIPPPAEYNHQLVALRRNSAEARQIHHNLNLRMVACGVAKLVPAPTIHSRGGLHQTPL